MARLTSAPRAGGTASGGPAFAGSRWSRENDPPKEKEEIPPSELMKKERRPAEAALQSTTCSPGFRATIALCLAAGSSSGSPPRAGDAELRAGVSGGLGASARSSELPVISCCCCLFFLRLQKETASACPSGAGTQCFKRSKLTCRSRRISHRTPKKSNKLRPMTPRNPQGHQHQAFLGSPCRLLVVV